VTLIFAKFGKDLFSNSKVIGHKTKWTWFLAHPVPKGPPCTGWAKNGTLYVEPLNFVKY